LATVLTIFSDYSGKELIEAHAPYAISPIPKPNAPSAESLFTKLFGIKVVPDLGILTTSFGAGANRPIVQRTWGLLGGAQNYGPNFRYGEYLKARNHFTALAIHVISALGALLLIFPPARWIIKKLIYQPGEGPSKEQGMKDVFEYRGIGSPDTNATTVPRAFVKMRGEGSIYRRKYR